MKKQGWVQKTGMALGMALILTAVAPAGNNVGIFGGQHVEAASVTYATTTNLNLRAGASTKQKVLVNVPKGKAVTMISYGSTWSKVKYGTKTGYVSTQFLKKNKTTEVSQSVAKTVKTYTTADNLTLRTGASVKNKKILTIPKGKAVTMVTFNPSWSKVKYGSKVGYVSSKYLIAKTTTVKPKPTPAPAPSDDSRGTLKPVVTKDAFLSLATAKKQLMDAKSPIAGKALYKDEGHLFVGSLMPSSDAQLTARHSIVFLYHDTKKVTNFQINTVRYRDNLNLRANGDKAILVATESVFGAGKNGSKELHTFINKYVNGKSTFTKDMTFGGQPATVNVGEFDIQIKFN